MRNRSQMAADDTLPPPTAMTDLAVVTRVLNRIKPFSYTAARKVVPFADRAIERALAVRPTGLFTPENKTSILNAKGHLDWHRNTLAGWKGDENAPYPSADDLKKWVEKAFIEYNAALEGAQYQEEKVSFWKEYGATLLELVEAPFKYVGRKLAETGIGTIAVVGVIAVGTIWALSQPGRRRRERD